MSIKKSLQLILIMASVIPVIVVSIIAHKILTDNIIIESRGYLQRTAEMNTSGLDSLINIQKTEVSLLSLQDEIVKAVTASNINGSNASGSVNNFLSARNFTHRKGIHISVYNSGGKIIASSERPLVGTDNRSNETFLDIMRYGNDAVRARLIQNKADSKTPFSIEVGAPILDNSQKAIGCIVSTISTSYFHELLNKIKVGDTGYAILLNQDGTIIYHPNPNFIGKQITSKKLSNLVEDYLIDDISQNNSFVYKYAGHKKAFGYCILPELNMVLIVQQDISDICSTTTLIFQLLCVECVIIMGFVILIAGYLAKKYTHPIIALRDAMRIASDGNLTVQSNIKSNNELGELSKNFNKMLHIIKTNYEDLESMHEELLSNEEQLRSNYDHIEFLAYHDTLTKLPNKLAFLDNVNAILEGSQTSLMRHAVYFVDLDNFKTVNDTLGHEYGDKLLAKTAHILTSLLGSEGMIARAGGDEFLLFKENILSNEEANDFASEIIQHFANPLDLNGEVVYVSMSIGIALYPENGTTSNVLIKNADIAMYKSKDTGKNKYTLFDKKMEEELSRNTQILEILRNAIDNKEIYIEYQPLLDLSTNSVISFEALMRINNERLGIINPSEFIPIAEESGIIIELSAWLLKEVCSFNKQLIDLGAKPRHVCVNISSVQINRPGFINLLSEILEETQLPPQYLELEITESTLVSSIMDATMLLTNLQNLGVRISLDDFGTGYSSLNYLTNMPIDTLKIDKSFVDHICVNRKDTYIAESIIQLAHSLDVRVVAEGVEQEDQLIALKKMHCHVIQGFVYSRPLSPIALIDLLSEDDLITQRTLF